MNRTDQWLAARLAADEIAREFAPSFVVATPEQTRAALLGVLPEISARLRSLVPGVGVKDAEAIALTVAAAIDQRASELRAEMPWAAHTAGEA